MQNKPIIYIITCTFFTVLGMIGGYMAGEKKAFVGNSHIDDHDHHDHDHDHQHHSHKSETVVMSPQMIKNLKIEIKEAEESNFEIYRTVNAKVEETEESILTRVAPIGGFVDEILVGHDEMIEAGAVLLTILRDAIKRPELKLTGALLDPEQRLRGATTDDLKKYEQLDANDRQILIWKTALKRNGYWPTSASEVFALLPVETRKLPFSLAVVGELVANGYLTKEFVDWFKSSNEIGEDFFEIASLVLDGFGLDYVQKLHRMGSLHSRIQIRAPLIEKDFDVRGIFVKQGEHVDVGQKLIELHDSRKVHMVANATLSEASVLMDALRDGLVISAVPQTTGSGLLIEGLKVLSIQGNLHGGANAHLELAKNPYVVKENELNKKYRSWEVRSGTRYMLRVPQKRMESVFVFPKNTIVEDGLEKIVFVKNGSTFDPRKVVVLYHDSEFVVLSQDSDLFSGDPVVISGAFELSLALQAQKGGTVDAHAGHNH